jgi:outer membrane protein assembly factor BamB
MSSSPHLAPARRLGRGGLLLLALVALVSATGCPYLKHGDAPPDAFFEGTKQFRHADYAAADQAFARVKERDPQYVDALVYRGRIAAIHGDIPGALTLMKQAESVNATKFHKDQNGWYHSVYGRYLTQMQIDTPEESERIAVDGATVVTLGRHGALTAWERASKKAIWSQALHADTGDHSRDDVIAHGGAVLAVARGVSGAELVAFALDTGREQWRASLGKLHDDVRLALDGDAVFATGETSGKGRATSDVRAFDLASGGARWTHEVAEHTGPLAAGGGRIVFRTHAGELVALRASDGAQTWSLGLPPKFQNDRPVLAGDLVLLATADGALYALDASDKSYDRPMDRVRWQLPVDPQRDAQSFPTVVGSLVVIAGRRGLDAYDLASGAARWHREIQFLGRLPAERPHGAIAQGDLVVAKLSNGVVAVDTSGTVRWIFQNLFAGRGSDRDATSEPGWVMGDASPVASDDGVWVAVRNSDVTHTLHLLALAPRVAY